MFTKYVWNNYDLFINIIYDDYLLNFICKIIIIIIKYDFFNQIEV
jgi:hypothetical protein